MRVRGPIVAVVTVALLLPVTTPAAQAQDGFLFDRPNVQFTFRSGLVMHKARGDLFDFITSELTLDRVDFRSPAFGGEIAVAVLPQLDVTLGLAYVGTARDSEFRHLVGEDDLPIEQTTSLRLVPLSLSTRYYPMTRGRTVSSLAWLPARTTPYIGAGVDLTWHRLRMEGEFVTDNDDITFQDYRSSGTAATAHARAGFDHWITPRIGLNFEGRYTIGSAGPTQDFSSYDSLDLTRAQADIGLTVRW